MAGERRNPIPVILVDQSDDPIVDDTNNALRVYIVATDVASGGTSAADDADFVAGTTSGTPAMGVYESSPSSVTDGDLGVVGITSTRALRVNVDNASSIGVQYAEDAQHASGNTGTMALAVRNDDLAALAGTDGDYAPLQVDSEGALYVVEKSLVDSNNSSTSVLAGGVTFTGTGTDVAQYASMVVSVEASHNSAADGLKFQFSSDNTNWDIISSFNYVAADGGISYVVPIEARYFRVVYTNGATLQTHFRLQSILHANSVMPTNGRLSDSVSPEKRGTIVKAAIVAQTSGAGNFVPVAATNGGSLKISLEEADGILGQAAMTASIPVVIASDQSVVATGGNVAHDDADSGNPVKVGGKASSSVPTPVGANDRANLWTGLSGQVVIGAPDTTPVDAASNIAAAFPGLAAGAVRSLLVMPQMFNGTTWDRLKGDATNGLLVNLGANNDVTVTSTVATDFEHFSNLDVDTAAEQLTAFACKFGVQIKADDDNTDSIYVGKSDVTAGTTDATDGFRLKAGQGVFLAVSNANLVYVRGGANNQKVWVLAV